MKKLIRPNEAATLIKDVSREGKNGSNQKQ
jgi:hypothetical protein